MANKIYYIYEIFGKKIGCTSNIERRMMQQKVYNGNYEILEAYTDPNIASIREKELQREYGYKVDRSSFARMMEWQSKLDRKEIASKIDWKTAKAKVDWSAAFKTHRTSKMDYKKIGDAQRDKPKHSQEHIEKMYKVVNQYDLEGNFIKQWNSVKSVKEQYKGDIDACCRGKQKTSAGFIWKYAN
jgi:hypothetical protein